MTRIRLIKHCLAWLAGAFVGLAGYIVVLINHHQAEISQLSNYNLAWVASQATVEISRFQQRITSFRAHIDDVDEDEVGLRFDILVSRLATLDAGAFREFLAADPLQRKLVDNLKAAIDEIDHMIAKIGQPEIAKKIVTIVDRFDSEMPKLASAAYSFNTEQLLSYQTAMRQLQLLFIQLVGGLFACGSGLVILLLFQNSMMRKTYTDLEIANADLERSTTQLEKAKSEIEVRNIELSVQNETLRIRDVQLHTQNDRFDAALNNMSHGLLMLDHASRLVVCNAPYLDMFGLRKSELPTGMSFIELRDRAAGRFAECIRAFDAVHRSQEKWEQNSGPSRFMHHCEDGRTLSVSCEHLPDEGFIATFEDVTHRRRAEARVQYLAHFDVLTELPNRTSFLESLSKAVAEADPVKPETFGLLSLDLDRFKFINDTFGHDVGDQVLRVVSARLRGCVRDTDIVCRFGGDEFAVLQTGVASRSDITTLANRILAAMADPIELEGRQLKMGSSIGITIGPADGEDAERLLKNADLALYRAKTTARGTYCFYEPAMDEDVELRAATELDLRHALGNNELEVHYQPIVSAKDCSVSGYEALLRWKHPVRGFVSPQIFIPIAEEIGAIMAIGEWVLRRACCDAASWRQPRDVSVNVSAVQLRSGNFVTTVIAAVAHSGIHPSRLILELTESALIVDTAQILVTLEEIKKLGVRISLDDFGTGYSSLSYLRKFPIDKVKIDKSFVDEVTGREDCLAIIESIVRLCDILDMTTVAEGVETRQQLEMLAAIGCTEVQGYYIAKPKPLHDLFESGLVDSDRLAKAA